MKRVYFRNPNKIENPYSERYKEVTIFITSIIELTGETE